MMGSQPPATPPSPDAVHLRTAVDPSQSCQNCGWGVADAEDPTKIQCSFLQILVTPQQVCDAWKPKEPAPGMDVMSQLFGPQGGPNA